VSLAVTLGAARLFARRLDRHATSHGVPEALVGVLTALAADSPEISSALVALAKGAPGASVGVVLGSNVFNLAAMIGVSALVAGAVRLPREALLLEGAVGALSLLVAALVLLGWLLPAAGVALGVAILGPYVLLLIRGPQILPRLRVRSGWADRVRRALAEREPASLRPAAVPGPMWRQVPLFAVDVALILGGSIGLVETALALGDRWHVGGALIGVLVLAPLTSLPNAFTGVRLGLAGRGSALVSETFNSNTINLAAGIVVPALFVGIPPLSPLVRYDLLLLGAMTAIALVLLARPRGMRRTGAVVLVAVYAGFVAVQAVLR
jgi:cation:H+ antiporter